MHKLLEKQGNQYIFFPTYGKHIPGKQHKKQEKEQKE